MPSLLDLRRRIKSVKGTQKITRAMQLVAASKMKKAQDAAISGRPYAEELSVLIENLILHVGDAISHPLALRRDNPKKIAYIMFTADRGLCGSFNSSITRYVLRREIGAGQTRALIAVGRKGMQFCKQFRLSVAAEFEGLADKPKFVDTAAIARVAIDGFLRGEFDEVRIVYNKFINTMTQVVTEKLLLPFSAPERTGASHTTKATDGHTVLTQNTTRALKSDYLFEPTPAAVYDRLIPRYIETQVWQALLESNASEQSARMVAMKSATENAKDLAADLTLEMNKARQAGITKELSEIVSGADALAA